jgi:hypothetical protein
MAGGGRTCEREIPIWYGMDIWTHVVKVPGSLPRTNDSVPESGMNSGSHELECLGAQNPIATRDLDIKHRRPAHARLFQEGPSARLAIR